MPHSKPKTAFSVRLGYARWLKHLADGEAPGHAEIGKAVGVTGPAVSGWMRRDDAPDWKYHRPLAAFLGVPEVWLVREEGRAPEPALWDRWLDRRQGIEEEPFDLDTIPKAPPLRPVELPEAPATKRSPGQA